MENTPAIRPPVAPGVHRWLGASTHRQSLMSGRRVPAPGGAFWRQYGTHVAVVLVAVLTLLLPQLPAPHIDYSLPRAQAGGALDAAKDDSWLRARGGRGAPGVLQPTVLERAGLVRTVEGDYPDWETHSYVVEAGDTLSGIAARYGLDIRTVLWANDALVTSPDSLSIGQELVILPTDGAYHTVAEGDSLQSIADKYKVSAEAILNYGGNDIDDPEHLTVGAHIIVPGAALPDLPAKVITLPSQGRTYTAIVSNPQEGSGSMIWPVGGYISQGVTSYHAAIDIAGDRGDSVVAADDGTVVLVSWMRTSYGYHVIVDHGNGLETLYAHLDSISVEVGQDVSKGTVLGTRGNTGRSTGPHLHFEVRSGGVRRNPFSYLP